MHRLEPQSTHLRLEQFLYLYQIQSAIPHDLSKPRHCGNPPQHLYSHLHLHRCPDLAFCGESGGDR